MNKIIFLGMFDQSVTAGPGTEGATAHTLEILIMLLGAFLLGYLLRYFIGASTRERVKTLEHDLSKSKANALDLETRMQGVLYEREKIETNYNELRIKYDTLHLAGKAHEEEIANLREQLASIDPDADS